MKISTVSSVLLVSVVSAANAEVVIGGASNGSFGVFARLNRIGLTITASAATGGGFDTLSISIVNDRIPTPDAASFVAPSPVGRITFIESESVSSAGHLFASIHVGTTDNFCYCDNPHNFIGTVGEMLYIGFSFDRMLDDSDDIVRNYGFFQMLKTSPNTYDRIGFAYETDADGAIQVFNLVPAPSTVFGLAAGGLLATRRRRV